MLNKKNLLFIFIFCLIVYSQLYSQQNFVTISGFVSDSSTGEVLTGTNILLYKDSLDFSNKNLFRYAITNQYGFYALPKVPGGNYYIIARNVGYKTLIKRISVPKISEVFKLEIEMVQKEIRLDEVIVKGEKSKDINASTIEIQPDLIKNLPSMNGETALFKSLQMIPGVKSASEISSGLYIRGGSPDQTLTLVDGMVVYNPAHLGNIASTFNTNALQSIRLIKGAYPAEYGGRLSSVLDIKLKSGTKEKDRGTLGISTISSQLFLEGPLSNNATYMLSGRKMYYDAFQKTFRKNSIMPRYSFYDFNSKLSYGFGKKDFLIISAMYSQDDIINPPSSRDINYNIEWQNSAIGVNWLQVNSKSYFSNTSFNYINYKFKSILDDINTLNTSSDYFATSQLQDFVFRRNSEFYLNENNLSKLGVELIFHKYDLLYSDTYDILFENDPSEKNSTFSSEASLYYQNEWQLSARLKTNFGGRFYYFHDNKYLRFEPRVSAAYSLDDEITVRSAFSIAHQFLHLVVRNDISLPTDLWYPSTNSVGPSKSSQYVFGIDKYFRNDYYVSVEGYYKFMNNLYEFKNIPKFAPQQSVEELFTGGKGEAYGIELFLNKTSGKLTGWIGYTLSWTKRQFSELNAGLLYYPKYDKRHDISLAFSYKFHENLNFGLTWVYSTGQGITLPTGQYSFRNNYNNPEETTQINYTQRNAFRMPSYHKLDLSIAYNIKFERNSLDLFLSIYNVYNRRNAFAQYISNNNGNDHKNNNLKLTQISLFPIIPTLGINLNF